MKKVALSLLGTLALTACSIEGSAPVVAAFNGDSVEIIQPLFASYTMDEMTAEATRVCQRANGRVAEPVSQRTLSNTYETVYLFLCLEPGGRVFQEKERRPAARDGSYL
ncbi:hypothetical protein [Roseovarius mucosus]|uniref:hypothetical protein n=1 Tax=Roseovarius mucosus TaxID=215743 RepID=UPI003F70F3E0|tara:strand:+ start:198 stop:524 length:327 start_codon:yes stop_codon:yes gene_type:complete